MTLPTTLRGPLDAPPVLFLHGFMGARDDWDAIVGELADDFRCIAIDLPGHGEAVDLPDEAYTFDGTLAAIADTLGALGIDRCRVVGYSMGGRIALGLALRYPKRVVRLVLASASPGLRTPRERAERRRIDAERAAAIEADFGAFLEDWARLPLFALDGEESRRRFIERRRRNIPAELARSLRGVGTGQQPSLWPDLESLTVPTLAVAGGRDAKYVDLVFEVAALAPTATPLVVPAGHAVHAERPDLFATLLRSFLSDPIPDTHLAL